jgi:hypothetical protein
MADISILANIALDDTATNDSTSTVGEPSVAVGGQGIFITGNWYASRSTDAGANWDHVDPFTTLPSTAGGFCCDQVTLHDTARGVWIWILQYIEQSGANVFRLAACADADFGAGGWYYWDIAPTTLDAGWTNRWFDYPDAALTDDNLYVTFNVFDTAGAWQRAAVMQFPLDTIANRGTLIFNAWSTTDNGSLRLTQGADATMYFASHNSDSQVRLFSWADGQTTISWWDINVTQYSSSITSTAPNGVDWLSRADTRITGAAIGGSLITLMWTAGSGTNRPHAYCKVARINEATKQLADQPDIFSNSRAWAYPAACTNGASTVGFTAFYGGADRNIGHVVGARNDAASNWTVAYAQLGSDSPNVAKWGDYLTCRLPSPGSDTGVAVGYTLEGGETRQDIQPRVTTFALALLPTGPTASGDDMQPGEVLNPGNGITSANGRYTFAYQGDGNLVLYNGGTPLWASNTDGSPVGVCIMQGDGNLVVYGPGGNAVWSSDTWHDPGSHLIVQDDGNVVIYRPDGSAVWATNTV